MFIPGDLTQLRNCATLDKYSDWNLCQIGARVHWWMMTNAKYHNSTTKVNSCQLSFKN